MPHLLHRLLPILLTAGSLLALPAHAQDARTTGQTIYLPVYSHLWHGDIQQQKPARVPLSALISIRNTDPKYPLRLLSAHYYNTQGRLLRDFVAGPQVIPPFGTLELFVERRENEGGSGANFVLRWQADQAINPPLIQAVHADVTSGRTLSFITAGHPIRD